jgi:hypothetical protein
MQMTATSPVWLPSDDEWLTTNETDELVSALRQLITELIGWGTEAA